MTNVVKKGVNRAGAAAARTRHAQRTPLPEKDAQPTGRPAAEVARGMAAEKKAVPKRGRRASDPGTEAVGALLGELAAPARKSTKKPAATPVLHRDGHPKLAEFDADAQANGWTVSTSADGQEMRATARRGADESIEVLWIGTRFVESTYHNGGYTLKMRNVSHARKVMAQDMSAKVRRPARLPRRTAGDPGQPRVVRKALPWSDNPLDEEVLSAVVGNTIVWKGELTDTYEEARIPQTRHETRQRKLLDDQGNPVLLPGGKPKMEKYEVQVTNLHLKIEENSHGRRVLSFTEEGGPFRACYVDAIVAVK